MRLITTLFLLILVFTASPAAAQLSPYDLAGRAVAPEIRLDPEFPEPNEEVTATLTNFNDYAINTTITWLLDGVKISDTNNALNISFNAGAERKTQTISAVIDRSSGRTIANQDLRPAYLDIIVEPQTHTPSFYQGRALPSKGSLVNLTALLSDSDLYRNGLLYTWRVGRVVLSGGPIYNNNKVSFEVPYGRDVVISLDITTPDGITVAEKNIIVPSVSPYLRFYEASSLFGLRTIPTTNLVLIGNSTAVRAEPYHLDSRVYNAPSIAEWGVSGQDYSDVGSNPYEITLQRTDQTGSSRLTFQVRDIRELLQGAKGSLNLSY
ncbi:hypothetical protein KC851_03260 [Candidatus Kaiserbacteria bacterium]|nr:hypothetical protein [Candidatus Kaiserbacteria bacterium]